jgi:hypothetical protein
MKWAASEQLMTRNFGAIRYFKIVALRIELHYFTYLVVRTQILLARIPSFHALRELIGWTLDQWHQVIERLKTQGLVWFEANSMFVWIKIWWDHHNCSQVMDPNFVTAPLKTSKIFRLIGKRHFFTIFVKGLAKHIELGLISHLIPTIHLKPYRYHMQIISKLIQLFRT